MKKNSNKVDSRDSSSSQSLGQEIDYVEITK